MPKNTDYDFSFRCPRCGGFLYQAEKFDCPKKLDKVANDRKPKKYFSEMFICINCGRIWIQDKRKLYLYPQGIPAEEVKLKKSQPSPN